MAEHAETKPEVLGTKGTTWSPETRLYSDGIVRAITGGPIPVPAHSSIRRIPGTCFLDPNSGFLPGSFLASDAEVESARLELAVSALPGLNTRFADMIETAMLDIDAACYPNGAVVAAVSPYWHYVWPRDASYISAALSLVGRHGAARGILGYLASVQETDGAWQARYLPDGSGGVPDDRGIQLDGNGWFLWAVWLDAILSSKTSPMVTEQLWPAARRALEAAIAIIDESSGLPRASQDFWEVDVSEPTLGVAAPILLALRTGADLAEWAGESDLATRATESAHGLSQTIAHTFGRAGYPRQLSGGGPDASVAFLLPPFAQHAPATETAWRSAMSSMTASNGGFLPGADWPETSTAWTPQTSLFALTAASVGDQHTAEQILDWLDRRRTRLGSLPEKVTADGAPAAVAPLPMTSATVIIAVAALEGRQLPIPNSPSPSPSQSPSMSPENPESETQHNE